MNWPCGSLAEFVRATELQALLLRIIKRLMKFLTRKGYLIEEQGMTYLADTDPNLAFGPCKRRPALTALRWGPGSPDAHGRGELLRRRVAASIARALIMASGRQVFARTASPPFWIGSD